MFTIKPDVHNKYKKILQQQILPKYSPAASQKIVIRQQSFNQDNDLVWYECLNIFCVNGVLKQYHQDKGLVWYECLNRFCVNALWKQYN